jgi:hypothetical protein
MKCQRILVAAFSLGLICGCRPEQTNTVPPSSAVDQSEDRAKLLCVCTEVFNNWLGLKPLLNEPDRTRLQSQVNAFANENNFRGDLASETERAMRFNEEILSEIAARMHPISDAEFRATAEMLHSGIVRVTALIKDGLLPPRAFSEAYSNCLFTLATLTNSDANVAVRPPEAATQTAPTAQLRDSPLRIIGTNLYDFSRVLDTASQYQLSGRVIRVFPKSLLIHLELGSESVFVPDIQRPVTGDPRDLLRTLAQVRMAYDTNGQPRRISAGEAFTYGIPGNFEQIPKTAEILLLNPPPATLHEAITFIAMPISTAVLPGPVPQSEPEADFQRRYGGSASQKVNVWDCGQPFSGDIRSFSKIHRVYSTGIKVEPKQ